MPVCSELGYKQLLSLREANCGVVSASRSLAGTLLFSSRPKERRRQWVVLHAVPVAPSGA
jgi:hypothetical protein